MGGVAGAKDIEIVSWLLVQPAGQTHADLARACAARFGADAWGEDRLRGALLSLPRKRGALPRAMRDPDVLAFVNARIGMMTYSDLAAECRARFGAKAPGRSALHRFAHRIGSLQRAVNTRLNAT